MRVGPAYLLLCILRTAQAGLGWAGLGWAGLAVVKVRNANSTRAAQRRALSVRTAFYSVAYCGRTSVRLAGAPSGSALAAPLPFAVRSRQTADGRREGGLMSLAVYLSCWVSTNAHLALQGAPSLPF